MKILVAVASKHGSTAEIAGAIGESIAERGIDVTVSGVDESPAIDDFDAVVVGSAVYGGRWMKPAADFVERNVDRLGARPVWLFSSGPLGDPPKPEGDPVDVPRLMALVGPRGHRVFAGKLEKSRLNFIEKTMVKAVHAPYGDCRNWDEIRGWASQIADALELIAGRPARR